ncbi:GGDEF domain-containing protein [Lysobacter helvus]|uniref:GGDEF domain-containing protein n=2 Tax=Lysobacteraceae TaxID=32033 RepID=A0ABN6FSX2_9GAMM|nr:MULTISPECIES: EAL domain-containing protein [Lysobacter]BCT91067.1 GGDEF domain-containing protein [Lysobacter caseinilyticus]BCT94220.1 GGDEF domain-containing protein [Lysobacter helvus]
MSDAHLRRQLAEAQAALEAERDRFRALFDAVPDPVSIIGYDGTVLDLNKAGIAAYKRPREDIIGQPIETLNPDLPRDHLAPVLETLSRGGTYVVEVTNMRADGTRFPVEVHSAGYVDEGQQRIVAVARDLSGRHEAELRYRELMEVIDKGILVRNAEGHVTYANPAAMRILKIPAGASIDGEMRPERWRVFDEHGVPLADQELPSFRALRTGQLSPSRVCGFLNLETRRLAWLSITSVPQFAPGADRPHQVLSLFSDVTGFKRDVTLFDRVQDLAHIGGWEWDAVSDHVYLTNEAQRVLGLDRATGNMVQLQSRLRDPERKRFQEALARAVEHGESFELDLQGIRADGHTLWVRIIGESERHDPTGTRVSGTLQDITEHRQAEETLRVQARTDPLTMLLNRDAVLEELEARLSDPAQSGVAVLYIDLDRFKVVNDVLGHAAGDQVIANAARRIQQAVSTEGLIARFGGDEFLVVCATGDDIGRPQRLAAAILGAFGESFRMAGEEFSITASIGIARAPEHGDRPQALIQNADVAMYDSKRRARNGWQDFSQALAEQQQHRLQMETHLRRAVDNREFKLVYQPQVDLVSGRTVGAEALIRWRNDTLGEMRPDHFIGHAENTGDIVRIGGWVLREACQQMRRWRDDGLPIVRIAVNVSYRQFLAEDLSETVAEALASAGLPGDALELEFTERVLIEDAPDTLSTFAALRMLGVVLSIDDFGEGYSALNYLRRLPIHGLKLSQLFLQGVPHNGSDVAICQAVAGIAQSLGLGLVAEGIENEAQRQFLIRLGVHIGQGFLFAPGLAPEELALRIQREHESTAHA